jgi:hypothetical protein
VFNLGGGRLRPLSIPFYKRRHVDGERSFIERYIRRDEFEPNRIGPSTVTAVKNLNC